jgi:serine/threonine protein kinase
VSDPTGTGEPQGDESGIDLGIPGVQDAIEIGVGGFGRVYRAEQPAFGRTVAVKVLAVGKLDERSQQRFERECQAMGALSGHPNIVTVFDAGTTEDGKPYLLMEYMSGGSYDDKMKADGSLGWQEASEVGAKVSAALQVAHDAGIVHRDIKPANVLISRFAEPQLGDFGIARITGGSETKSGVITASMAHAAPEVLDGTRPSGSADIYAVGSMVYEMVAGTPAFFSESDETNLAMIRRIYDDPVPDLRAKGVPDPIARVVEQAMAKKPEQRQSSAAELAEQFRAALREAGDTSGAQAAEQAAAAGAAAVAHVDPSETSSYVAGSTGPQPAVSTPTPTPPPGYVATPTPPPGYVSTPTPTPPPGYVSTPVGGPPPGAVPFTTGPVPAGGGKGGGAKLPLIILAVVVGVLVVGGVGAFALTSGGDGGGDPPPTTPPETGPDVVFLPEADAPDDFGDDTFNALAGTCEAGDLVTCDILWLQTEVGSDEEEYGATCGGRTDGDPPNECADDFDEWPLPTAQAPGELGDDADLDDLADECQAGDLRSCDDLFFDSDSGSTYSLYGTTCGGRIPSAASEFGLVGGCDDRYDNAVS